MLASTTVTAPTCATGEPTASPTEDPTTPPTDPGGAVPTDAPGPGGPTEQPTTEPPTTEQTTPRTPAVVQTDGVSRDVSAPLVAGAGALLILGGVVLAARRTRPVRVHRRH